LLRKIFLNDFILVILICISTDIGGFVFGKIFKGPKLTKISPNKTYSGMIGSFLLSIISALFYTNYYGLIYWTDNVLLITVILISFVSQIGDLTVSYFKRISKIKNTGKIIPGHGGLLDRIDGMLFAIPFAFIFLKMIKFI
jgi:phosphatidate cytidylyltransferase